MNILSLTYEYPPIGGGGSVVAAALNQQLASTGHRVRVVTSAMNDLRRVETVNGVEVYRAACWRRHRHYTTVFELLTTLWPAYQLASRLIREQRPDLIHVHFAIPSGLVAYLLARRYRIPYVITAHGSDIPEYNPDRFMLMHRLFKPVWRRIVAGAAAVTSPSEYLARLLRRHLATAVYVIPNGYSVMPALKRTKRNLVLVVARLFPRKGVQHFIEAVSGQNTAWEYVIAGDGPYRQTLEDRARTLGAKVKFAGFVDKITLRGLYEEAKVFVFPSIQENFPMVLLEAMDAGCAVITTDAEGCAEVVGDAGVVIQKANALQIRRALGEVMLDSERRESLSKCAEERVQQFRWPRIASLYCEVFTAVLQSRVAAVHSIGTYVQRPTKTVTADERVA